MPFSSLASTASSSNAARVWEDFSNNLDDISNDIALSEDDISLASEDDIMLLSDSDSVRVDFYGMTSDGQTYYTSGFVGQAFSLPTLTSGHYVKLWFDIGKKWLPSSGTYRFAWSFTDVLQNICATNVDNIVGDYVVILDTQKNVDNENSTGSVSVSKSENLWTSQCNVTLSAKTSLLAYYMNLYDSANITSVKLVLRGFTAFFKTDPNLPSVDAPAASNQSSSDAIGGSLDDIASNSATQVEQGNSIIELIKNTIQTISSQLEAFWLQLSGEFTNLYNKMNAHHAEDLQSDEDTRTTISEEAETSRNFIVNGIIEGLKSLFIPSDDYFKAWFDDIYAFFNDRFGFLMFPVDILVKMVNLYVNADSSFAGVPFPEFKWIDGSVIIPAQTVQFTYLETDWGQGIQQKLYFVGNVIMIGALLSLIHRKFEEVLRN